MSINTFLFAAREEDHIQAENTDQLRASAGLKIIRSNIKHELINYMSKLIVVYDTAGHLYR